MKTESSHLKEGDYDNSKLPEAAVMQDEILNMEDDEQFKELLEEKSLEYLKTKDRDFFQRQYSGELSPEGYLMRSDGKETNFKPWQNIGGGLPMQEIMNNAKKEFARQFLEQAAKYPEMSAFIQRENHSSKKDKLEGSIQETKSGLEKARMRLGIQKTEEIPPSLAIEKSELEKTEAGLTEAEDRIKQEKEQGEAMESFLERDYGVKENALAEKGKKTTEDYLAAKPEDKDEKIKGEIMEKIDKNYGKPSEKEQEEVVRQEAVSGISQETKKQAEKERRVVGDVENLTGDEPQGNERENDGQQEAARNVLEKMRGREFIEYAMRLAMTLRTREEDRLSQIIHPDAINYLVQSARKLEDMQQSSKLNLEEINQSILRMSAVINAIGKDLPRSGMVREDTDSLRKVSYALRNLGESSQGIIIQLGGLEDDNLQETIGRMKQLYNLTEERWSYVVRKRQIIEDR